MLSLMDLAGCSVEITLCDDAFMRGQNKKHMGHTATTDVLSFPQLPPQGKMAQYRGKFLGDILISLDQARRQARDQGIGLRREILFLIMHSLLHLVGYDHATEQERLTMQECESRVWRALHLKIRAAKHN